MADETYDLFASEKFVPTGISDWSKQAAPKDWEIIRDLAQGTSAVPQRAIEAASQYQPGNPETYNPGPIVDAAAMATLGAGAFPAEAGALRSGLRFPEGYYDKIPQEMRLSRKGISHPGYRWEVFDPKTGKVMRKDLTTRSGANAAVDRLDNQYGGYRYQVRPVEAKQLTEEEIKILKEKGIDLGRAGVPAAIGTGAATGETMAKESEDGDKKQAKSSGGTDPKMSPGVMKWMMEFLKANPDLAKEMSTRMNAVINGKTIQAQQGKGPPPPPGGAQMPGMAGPPGAGGAPPQMPGAMPPQMPKPPGM